MSTKNTKKNETSFAAVLSSLDEIATGSEGKHKELVSINCVPCWLRVITRALHTCSYESKIRHVVIVIGFQNWFDLAKLSARYQEMGLEAAPSIKLLQSNSFKPTSFPLLPSIKLLLSNSFKPTSFPLAPSIKLLLSNSFKLQSIKTRYQYDNHKAVSRPTRGRKLEKGNF